jgi:GT2 family glycosyltransferase
MKLNGIAFIITIYNHHVDQVQNLINNVHEKIQYTLHKSNYKIVIVNNGNSDLYFDGADCINVGKNVGYCEGNNIGIRTIVDQETIIICNPDVKITNSLIFDYIYGYVNLSDCVCGKLVGTSSWYTYAASFPTDKQYDPDELPFYYNEPTLTKSGNWKPFRYIDGHFFGFSRKLFNDVGGFNKNIFPGYFGESEFCFRAYLNGFSLQNVTMDGFVEHNQNHSVKYQADIVTWTELGRKQAYRDVFLPNWSKFIEYLDV